MIQTQGQQKVWLRANFVDFKKVWQQLILFDQRTPVLICYLLGSGFSIKMTLNKVPGTVCSLENNKKQSGRDK